MTVSPKEKLLTKLFDSALIKTRLCIFLKSNIYFQFHWPLRTKSMLFNLYSIKNLDMLKNTITAWKLCTPLKWDIYFCFLSATPDLELSHFWVICKIWQKLVTNCRRLSFNNALINTETRVCTSLKSDFYFQFCIVQPLSSELLKMLWHIFTNFAEIRTAHPRLYEQMHSLIVAI